MSALQTQIGGDHYSKLAIQPVEYITRNGLGFVEGSVIKYVTRHKAKGGAEDIKKAIHFLSLLLELEYGKKEEKAEECKARFDGLDLDGWGKGYAMMRNHVGTAQSWHKMTVQASKDHSPCPTCRAAASLALVELTKP